MKLLDLEVIKRIAPFDGVKFKIKAYQSAIENQPEKRVAVGSPEIIQMTMKEIMDAIFPVNSIWHSRDDIFNEMNRVGQIVGFGVSKTTNAIQCSMSGQQRHVREQNGGTSQKNGCPFKITLNPLFSTLVKNRKATCNNKCLVVISKVSYTHNHECSVQVRHQCDASSGNFSKQLPEEVMFILLNILRTSPQLKPNQMRPFLEDCGPTNKVWTASQLSNLRRKLVSISSKMSQKQIMRRELFNQQFQNKEFWKGYFENPETDFYADKSTFECKEVYDELFGGCIFQTEDGDNPRSTIIEMNQVYKINDSGFDFAVHTNGEGEIIAIFWQTGAMRDAFDRYGSYCCVDAMLRTLNTSGLPYLAIVVFDEHGMMLRALEGLVFTESMLGYRFAFDDVVDMAGKRSKEDILVVAGDLFFNQNMVTNDFGLPNAIYVADQWHLILAVQKFMGPVIFEAINLFFRGMITANSENNFQISARDLIKILNEKNANANQLGYARTNLIDRETRWLYAQFELDDIEGTLGRHGSTASEQNHSSIATRLGKGYCAHPTREQRDLIDITLIHQSNLNDRLKKGSLELEGIHANATNKMLHDASARIEDMSLNIVGYELLFREFLIAGHYHRIELEDGKIEVRHDNRDEVVVFECKDQRCVCRTRMTKMIVCCHEIVKNRYTFEPEKYAKRYLYRKQPTMVRRNPHRDDFYPSTSDIRVEAKRVRQIIDNRKVARATGSHDSASPAISTDVDRNLNIASYENENVAHMPVDPKRFTREMILAKATACVNTVWSISNDIINGSLYVVLEKISKLVKNGIDITAQSFVNEAKNALAMFQNTTSMSSASDPVTMNNSFRKKQNKARIHSSQEIESRKRKTKTPKSCTVCSNQAHTRRNCPNLNLHGIQIDDLDMFNTNVTHIYHYLPTHEANRIPSQSIPGILHSNRVKHFVVHSVISRVEIVQPVSSIDDLNFLISGLKNDCSEIDDVFRNVVVTASSFMTYARSTIPRGQTGTRKKFVFDNIREDGQGKGYLSRTMLSQHAPFHYFPRNPEILSQEPMFFPNYMYSDE